MQKYYFELDKVDSITLIMERDSEYKWFEEIPDRPRKFLGLRFGTIKGIPAGWSSYDLEDHHYNSRKPSSYFDEYNRYKVDEENKKVFRKAYVEVSLGYKRTISRNFESNEEAQSWVDDLISDSNKKFHVIVRN
jgi:hypothetical protein